MKAAEVGQRRQILGQRLYLPFVDAPFDRAGVFETLVQLLRDFDQHLDEVGRRAPRGADVGHEQHGIARGLVDLDAIAVHQNVVLEGVAVEARLADEQREARGVQCEFVLRPGFPDIVPAVLPVVVGLDARLTVVLRHHVADGQHPEILAEQRVAGDSLAQHHGHLDLLLNQLEAFQLDLAAADVERGENLVIGRGRRVGHVGLEEGFLGLGFEVLIVDVNHRALAQRRERLVGGLGGVDPDPHPFGVGQQPVVEPGGVVIRVHVVERRLVGGIALPIVGAAEARTQVCGNVHGGALAVARAEACETEPSLVPQEHQIGLDGQALFHDPLDVVDDTVEGAVGEQQHLHAVEPPGALERQEVAFHLAQRHRAVHGVLGERIGFQVNHLGAAQHHAVVVRFVAVAVHQHDVAGLHQGLHDDLVAGRGAVGGEEGAACPEGTGGQLLRLLDRPVGFQERVEAARGGRGLGQEDVHAIELAHVLDPMGLADRLAARDRHGVEHARRLLAEGLERREERRLIAGVDAAQDVEMQLHIVFLIVEDAPAGGADLAGDILDRLVGHQVDVELRAQLRQQMDERGAIIARQDLRQVEIPDPRQIALQQFQLVPRFQREAIAHDHGLQIMIEQHADQRVLQAGHDDGFIDEGVLGAAHLAQANPQQALLMGAQIVDEQDLEIGPGKQVVVLGLEGFFLLVLGLALNADRDGPAPVGIAHERAYDSGDRTRQRRIILPVQKLAELMAGVAARKNPIAFDGRQEVERPGRLGLEALRRIAPVEAIGEAGGDGLEPVPGIRAELRGVVMGAERKLVHRTRRFIVLLCHDDLPATV